MFPKKRTFSGGEWAPVPLQIFFGSCCWSSTGNDWNHYSLSTTAFFSLKPTYNSNWDHHIEFESPGRKQKLALAPVQKSCSYPGCQDQLWALSIVSYKLVIDVISWLDNIVELSGLEPLLHCIQQHHQKIGDDAQRPPWGWSHQAGNGEGGNISLWMKMTGWFDHFGRFGYRDIWSSSFGYSWFYFKLQTHEWWNDWLERRNPRWRIMFQVNGSAHSKMDPTLKESSKLKGDSWQWRRGTYKWYLFWKQKSWYCPLFLLET